MNKTHGKPYRPYEGLYHNFYEASQNARGYQFEQGPRKKIAPPTPKGLNPPACWSFDRPKRLGIIRRMRDQYQNKILDLRKNGEGALSWFQTHLSAERQRSGHDGVQKKFTEESEEQKASQCKTFE